MAVESHLYLHIVLHNGCHKFRFDSWVSLISHLGRRRRNGVMRDDRDIIGKYAIIIPVLRAYGTALVMAQIITEKTYHW